MTLETGIDVPILSQVHLVIQMTFGIAPTSERESSKECRWPEAYGGIERGAQFTFIVHLINK